MVLLYVCICFAAGIYAGRLLYNAGIYLHPVFALALLCIAAAALVFTKKSRWIVVISLCIAAAAGGAARYQSHKTNIYGSDLSVYENEGITIRGIIASDPEARDSYTLLHLSCTGINSDGDWQSAAGNILVYAQKYPDFGYSRSFPYYRYGDEIEMKGRLQQPPSFDDFDYGEYLAEQNIYFIVYYPQATLVSEENGSPVYSLIFDLRTAMTNAIEASLHEPQCAMTQAILLGKRGTLPDALYDDLTSSGTMHLFAISGIHISIIAGICTALGAWLLGRQRYLYLLFPFIVIWLYAMVSGMYPSAVRASIMCSVYLLAIAAGRQNSTSNALALTAAVMVAIEPQILWDIGFQLSFLAMSGIVLITPHLQLLGFRFINSIGSKAQSTRPNPFLALLVSSLSITMGAMLATMPALAYYFGRISLASLPATLLALPFIPLAIISGAAVGITGTFSLALSRVIGWPTWTVMSYINHIIGFFARLPLASVEIKGFSAIYIFIIYLLIVTILLTFANRKRINSKSTQQQ